MEAVMGLDLSRVFYANGIGFSFNPTEAVFIFKLRAIEEQPPGNEQEVVRIHVPTNLADALLTVMAK